MRAMGPAQICSSQCAWWARTWLRYTTILARARLATDEVSERVGGRARSGDTVSLSAAAGGGVVGQVRLLPLDVSFGPGRHRKRTGPTGSSGSCADGVKDTGRSASSGRRRYIVSAVQLCLESAWIYKYKWMRNDRLEWCSVYIVKRSSDNWQC